MVSRCVKDTAKSKYNNLGRNYSNGQVGSNFGKTMRQHYPLLFVLHISRRTHLPREMYESKRLVSR